MTYINLNEKWKALPELYKVFDYEIPPVEEEIDLPYDLLSGRQKEYDLPYSEFNGSNPSSTFMIYKRLPKIEKHRRVVLDVSGVSGVCEVILNGETVKLIASYSRVLTDITPYLSENENILRLKFASYYDSGKYTGSGIAGGVGLIVSPDELFIEPLGVFVQTTNIGEKALLNVSTAVKNASKEPRQFGVFVEIFNAKKRRITKKFKKVKLLAGAEKVFELPVKMGRYYPWSCYDPYKYGVKVSLTDLGGDKVYDTAEEKFGITQSGIYGKSLKINGSALKLKGAVVMHDNGILGNVSEYSVEYRKLKAVKDLGFNAVRYIGCPTDAVLDAADDVGLYLVADIFDGYGTGTFLNDGHLFFNEIYTDVAEYAVKTLRRHPCCIMYGLCNDAEESYGRHNGVQTAKNIIEIIRRFDKNKLITANVFERVPTRAELERYEVKVPKGIGAEENRDKKLIALAREKDLFLRCTEEFLSLVDVAGYSYLYPRYSTDKTVAGRIIMGTATYREKAYDALEETDKHLGVIGDFAFCAYDFIGKQEERYVDHDYDGTFPAYANSSGLFDICGRKKDIAYYTEILLGKKNITHIVVEDPDRAGENGELGENGRYWNWPKHIGKPVRIIVYTSGDIVALFLDGKSIGRKLAGKFNKHIAEFKTNFYPGKLEAISYRKGVEQSRDCIESVGAPKMLKAECRAKTIDEGDLCYIDISVTDKDDKLVPYAIREVEIEVTGEGELVSFANADPVSVINPKSGWCSVYEGVCTAVVRGTSEGRVTVKAVSDGLRSCKANVKVRPKPHK